MAQSLSQIYIHIVFHTKNSHVYIPSYLRDRFYSYITGIIRKKGSIPLEVGDMFDHIHILCSLSKNTTVSELVQFIKQGSSRWIKYQHSDLHIFEWQAGYGVFSVSPSLLYKTKMYIINQEEHHKKVDTKEEYILFLKEYGISYSEEYLWEKEK